MSCIGNDVVDLQHPENAKKSRDSRYLKKILTNAEIEFVHDAENPGRALWAFWACKETAYKVISKSYAGASFLPRRWSVRLKQYDGVSTDGEVIISGGNAIFVHISFAESYVHCLGSDNLSDLGNVIRGIESLPKSTEGENVEPSLFVRQCLLARLADVHQLSFRAMEIRREKKGGELQPPYLYFENKKAPFDISLSHDGRFVAYAFLEQAN